jgi:hypothetical protein
MAGFEHGPLKTLIYNYYINRKENELGKSIKTVLLVWPMKLLELVYTPELPYSLQ